MVGLLACLTAWARPHDVIRPTFSTDAFTGVDVPYVGEALRVRSTIQRTPSARVAPAVAVAFDVARRATFGVRVPFRPGSPGGLSDIATGARLSIVGSRWSRGSFALRADLHLPDPGVRASVGAIGALRFGSTCVAADLGLLGDTVTWSLAARHRLPDATRLAFTGQLLGRGGAVDLLGGVEFRARRRLGLGLEGGGAIGGSGGVRVVGHLAFEVPTRRRKPLAYAPRAAPAPPAGGAPSPVIVEIIDSPMVVETQQVTVGGSQDVRFLRERVRWGDIPAPGSFTFEGLFSEHSLPLLPVPCSQRLCPVAAAARVELPTEPDVQWLLQVGFSSMGAPRRPARLVLVLDTSASMDASMFEVRSSIYALVSQMVPGDELGIVTFDDEARVVLEPTPTTRLDLIDDVVRQVDATNGSTNLDEGLALGYALAERGMYDGTRRVVVVTDQRPNLGRQSSVELDELVRRASRAGIATTILGVSLDFDAALADAMGQVPGGNVFFFADALALWWHVREELDTMIQELARDVVIRIDTQPGFAVVGTYGVPGRAVEHLDDGLRMKIGTLFPSRRPGGLFVGLRAEGSVVPGGPVARVSVSYSTPRGRSYGLAWADQHTTPPLGLVRGARLVDEALVLEKVLTAYERGDLATSLAEAEGLAGRLHEDDADDELDIERELVADLLHALGGEDSSAEFGAMDEFGEF